MRERYELIMRDYEAITPTTLQTFISEQPGIDSDKRRASGTKKKYAEIKQFIWTRNSRPPHGGFYITVIDMTLNNSMML